MWENKCIKFWLGWILDLLFDQVRGLYTTLESREFITYLTCIKWKKFSNEKEIRVSGDCYLILNNLMGSCRTIATIVKEGKEYSPQNKKVLRSHWPTRQLRFGLTSFTWLGVHLCASHITSPFFTGADMNFIEEPLRQSEHLYRLMKHFNFSEAFVIRAGHSCGLWWPGNYALRGILILTSLIHDINK